MADKGTALSKYKENLLKGVELKLPEGHHFSDKSGFERKDIRTRWWESLAGKTYRQAVFPDSGIVPDYPIPTALMNKNLKYDASEPPVFFGHYWMPVNTPKAPLAPNVACLDYSVAKDGELVAYRWDGELILLAEKFITTGN